MTHESLQEIIAFAIVAVAAFSIARRLWSQALAFRRRPSRRASPAKPRPNAAASPLIQIQVKPPVHLKRPPVSED